MIHKAENYAYEEQKDFEISTSYARAPNDIPIQTNSIKNATYNTHRYQPRYNSKNKYQNEKGYNSKDLTH